MTTTEAASYLGCDPSTIRHLVGRGVLTPAKRYPRLMLFKRADIEAYAVKPQHGYPRGRPRAHKPTKEGDGGGHA